MRQMHTMWVLALAVALCVGLSSCGAPSEQAGSQATVEVASFPAADIWIDGTWKGSTPASISVDPGSHELMLRQTGFGEHQEKIDVVAGSRHKVDCVLIAQDLDDPQVLAHLARPFDVAVEPFEAPEPRLEQRPLRVDPGQLEGTAVSLAAAVGTGGVSTDRSHSRH